MRRAAIVTIVPGQDLSEALDRAREVLSGPGLVAYPTESFYGLAALISSERAIERLFQVKERDPHNPILILIPSKESLQTYVTSIPPFAQGLMETFWPGGLTLVFEGSPRISSLLMAGTGKIGIRLSSHPVATGLAKAAGSPITGTSANLSGHPPCSTAQEVARSLGDRIDLILDGGRTEGGVPSTILDVTSDPPHIVREGMISRGAIERVLGIHLP